MAYTQDELDAIARLDAFYNGNAYKDPANTGGMAAGGHRYNFIDSLRDVALLCPAIADEAVAAAASAVSALAAKVAAIAAKDAAETAQTGAETAETNAATSASNAATSETNAAASETDAESAASSVAINWKFDNSTDMADPGQGDLRLNHATLASVTAIAVSKDTAETGNPDVSDYVVTWDDSTNTALRGTIILRKRTAPATFAIYSVTGTVTDNTDWLQIAVTHVVSNGALSNTDDLYVQFLRTGNAGGGLTDVVNDLTPQLGGFLDPNSKYIGMAKGGNIASGSPLVIDTDGDYFDVTGTTGFSVMTVAANRHFFARFTGILTMTHGASLSLPGEANITTAAGDVGEFFSTGADTVQCVNFTRVSGKSVVSGDPPGKIADFAGTSAPSGWLVTDGSAISRTTYADLFAYIGTLWGIGDGSTTFNIPDGRERYVRAAGTTNSVGDTLSSQNKSHTHTGSATSGGAHVHTGSTNSTGSHYHDTATTSDGTCPYGRGGVINGGSHAAERTDNSQNTNTGGAHSHTVTINSGGAHTHTLSINSSGGTEARPDSIVYLECIKT